MDVQMASTLTAQTSLSMCMYDYMKRTLCSGWLGGSSRMRNHVGGTASAGTPSAPSSLATSLALRPRGCAKGLNGLIGASQPLLLPVLELGLRVCTHSHCVVVQDSCSAVGSRNAWKLWNT